MSLLPLGGEGGQRPDEGAFRKPEFCSDLPLTLTLNGCGGPAIFVLNGITRFWPVSQLVSSGHHTLLFPGPTSGVLPSHPAYHLGCATD